MIVGAMLLRLEAGLVLAFSFIFAFFWNFEGQEHNDFDIEGHISSIQSAPLTCCLAFCWQLVLLHDDKSMCSPLQWAHPGNCSGFSYLQTHLASPTSQIMPICFLCLKSHGMVFFFPIFCAGQSTNDKMTWQAHWFYCNFKSWSYFILYKMHHMQGNHRGERVICLPKDCLMAST